MIFGFLTQGALKGPDFQRGVSFWKIRTLYRVSSCAPKNRGPQKNHFWELGLRAGLNNMGVQTPEDCPSLSFREAQNCLVTSLQDIKLRCNCWQLLFWELLLFSLVDKLKSSVNWRSNIRDFIRNYSLVLEEEVNTRDQILHCFPSCVIILCKTKQSECKVLPFWSGGVFPITLHRCSPRSEAEDSQALSMLNLRSGKDAAGIVQFALMSRLRRSEASESFPCCCVVHIHLSNSVSLAG